MILRNVDLRALSSKNRLALMDMQSAFSNARRYILDFEGSENPEEQAKGAKTGTKWLKTIRRTILTTSEHNVFSAVEVASLSAQIDQVIAELK